MIPMFTCLTLKGFFTAANINQTAFALLFFLVFSSAATSETDDFLLVAISLANHPTYLHLHIVVLSYSHVPLKNARASDRLNLTTGRLNFVPRLTHGLGASAG